MVNLDVMDDNILAPERYPENFMLISQLKVCQEGGIKKGGTWMIFTVPDHSHGGHDHSCCHE